MMTTKEIAALEITKYKLSVVCQDTIIAKDFPEMADKALALIQEIDRKIISQQDIVSDVKSQHQPTRDRIQRTPISF